MSETTSNPNLRTSSEPDRGFLLRWILAGALGWGLGGMLGVLLGRPGLIIENGYLMISLGGIVAALFQSILLRSRLSRAGWWPLSALGGALVFGIVVFGGMQFHADVAWILGALLFPLATGFLQWRSVLRRHRSGGTGWWVPTVLVAFFAGAVIVGFGGAALGISGREGVLDALVVWSSIGALSGVISGIVLSRLLGRVSSRSPVGPGNALPVALLMITLVPGSPRAESLDLAPGGFGLSLGNSKRLTGIRINAVDSHVERINGLNLTLWTPGENSAATYNGVGLGLIGCKGRRIHGVALGGIGVNAADRIWGVGAGTLGVGARRLTGFGAGLILVDVKEHARGVVVAGGWTGFADRFEGLALSPGAAMAKDLRGAAVGGLFAGGGQSLSGLALSPGVFHATRLRGLGIGGLGGGGKDLQGLFAAGLFLGCEDLDGLAVSLGGIGGLRLDGIMVAGLGLGAVERIRGFAVGGTVIFAPEMTGFTFGALNGLYIDRIDLEDFLHFNMVNRRFTGLSIGLVNYTAQLKGVQIGLVNYAGNNPRWARLLPLVNVHL